ncbi:MAG: inositol monophosphatase [Rhodobacteraceae bacterium]|nr:inositol monophosphatase [Paracoccaceae bacterium]
MTLDPRDAAELIRIARTVAATEVVPRWRRPDPIGVSVKSNPQDLVTEADTAAEAALIVAIRDSFGWDVVGEEGVSADPAVLGRLGRPGRVVVVDPIDGTWNYAKGQALFGMILAVVEDGQTVWGLHLDPLHDDWVWAGLGQGAHWARADGVTRALRVSAVSDLAAMQGFVSPNLFPHRSQAALAATLPGFARAMSLRCSAHEYRMLAEGHADFNLSATLHPWDHAAGALMVTEAGGVARLLDGTPYGPALREGFCLAAATEAGWNRLAQVFAVLNGD